MAYFLDSIKFIAGSVKYGTTDKIELRADLVEYINEINFEKAKEYLEAKFRESGYCCIVLIGGSIRRSTGREEE